MMNLSSLSKASWILAFALAADVVGVLFHFFGGGGWAWDDLLDLAILGFLAVGVFFVRKAECAVRGYTAAAAKVAEGDLESRILNTDEHGDLGALATAINRLFDLTDSFLREVSHSMDKVSQGKYYRKVIERGLPGYYRRSAKSLNDVTHATEARVNRFMVCTKDFETSTKDIVSMLSSEAVALQKASENMSDTAERTSQRSDSSNAAANQATQNVQNVASAAEELSASITEISRRVEESSAQASTAAKEAEQTDKLVRGLDEAAQKVSGVVQLINDIASQTNLLALNATIEAARAGEAGKGFAVVANEVKTLANQTAKATDEITHQIEAMQGATVQAVQAVATIGKMANQVSEISSGIAIAVDQQRLATQEIAKNIQQAAASTAEVTTNIHDVSAGAVETKSAATKVLSVAEGFVQQSDVLQKEVSKFLSVIRAN